MRTVLPNNLHFERNFLLAAVQLQQLSHAAILNEKTNYSINLDGMGKHGFYQFEKNLGFFSDKVGLGYFYPLYFFPRRPTLIKY